MLKRLELYRIRNRGLNLNGFDAGRLLMVIKEMTIPSRRHFQAILQLLYGFAIINGDMPLGALRLTSVPFSQLVTNLLFKQERTVLSGFAEFFVNPQ